MSYCEVSYNAGFGSVCTTLTAPCLAVCRDDFQIERALARMRKAEEEAELAREEEERQEREAEEASRRYGASLL